MSDDRFIDEIREYLSGYDGDDIYLMEVCGSHTQAISKYGISELLSEKIHLLSGPGCPVCVTPSAYIDKLIELAKTNETKVLCFGDMMRVPGSRSSLSASRAEGGDVEFVYSPMEIINRAENEPEKKFVFAAVGFETTAPVYALLIDMLIKKDIKNVRLLTALKTMPSVISYLLDNGAKIDGFIAPGHVAAVTGSELFVPLSQKYEIPFAVAGFEALELLVAVYGLVKEVVSLRKKRCLGGETDIQGLTKNYYTSVVTEKGNPKAKALVNKYFTEGSATWRGMGEINGSGLYLRKEYIDRFDAGSLGLSEDIKLNDGCQCARVLMGKILPIDCPLFGKVCSPADPKGACMVSSEGACAQYFTYKRTR